MYLLTKLFILTILFYLNGTSDNNERIAIDFIVEPITLLTPNYFPENVYLSRFLRFILDEGTH